jgi:hypothetical protein
VRNCYLLQKGTLAIYVEKFSSGESRLRGGKALGSEEGKL